MEMKQKEEEIKEPPKKDTKPKYICVDNCCQVRKSIYKIYEDYNKDNNTAIPMPTVSLDVKHLINRLLECCNNRSTNYQKFCQAIHAAVVGTNKIEKLLSNGKQVQVKQPLDTGTKIWERLLGIINNFKDLDKACLKE
jgi:hypothetical protein